MYLKPSLSIFLPELRNSARLTTATLQPRGRRTHAENGRTWNEEAYFLCSFDSLIRSEETQGSEVLSKVIHGQ